MAVNVDAPVFIEKLQECELRIPIGAIGSDENR